MTAEPAAITTPAAFLLALNRVNNQESLNQLLQKVQQLKCPFRQRQALLDCWQSKSKSIRECSVRSVTAAIIPPSPLRPPPSRLKVEPVEFEPDRYWVQSRTNGGIPYLVDMEEYNGNGWCGCQGFLHYIEALEQGAAPSPTLQCRHLKAVREYLRLPTKNLPSQKE